MAAEGIRTRDEKHKQRPKEGMEHTCAFACETGLLQGGFEGPWITATDWVNIAQLGDTVHQRLADLANDDENAIIFAAYALLVMNADKNGHFGWGLSTPKHAATEINDQIMAWKKAQSGNLLSDEKFRTWEDWVAVMGLLMPEATLLPHAPYPLTRMRREVLALSAGQDSKGKVSAKEFWRQLVARMPYLDGGSLWNSIRTVSGVAPFESTLSLVSSVCLSQLAAEQIVDLEFVPDAQLGIRLRTTNRVVSAVTMRSSETK
jgi:hypothetical protein